MLPRAPGTAARTAVPVALAALVAGLTGPLLAPPAAASCAAGTGPAGSPVVFVGTAEAERRGYTRFEVVEVWTGPDLAGQVWVRSGQEQPPWPLSLLLGVASSVDADFAPGRRYVVGASRGFATNACTVAAAPGPPAGLAGRPDRVRPPDPAGAAGVDPPLGPLGQALTLAVPALAVAAALALRRRRAR